MVIDTSALIAILWREPEEAAFRTVIKLAPNRLLGTASWVECGMLVLGRTGEAGLEQMQALLNSLQVEIVAISPDHARLAVDAFRRFGKGRHPAGLNFGDCFSYALAKATGEALLFKGGDFSKTDILQAA